MINDMIDSPRIHTTHFTVPLPEKMEVRVVEYEKDNRIVKVELQYRMHYFDQYGQPVTKSDWQAVERVRIDMDDAL